MSEENQPGQPQPTVTAQPQQEQKPKTKLSMPNISLASLVKWVPSIQKPEYKQNFNNRLMWTGVALLLYLVCANITIIGLAQANYEQFRFLEIVLGSRFGSLMTLGIGPIVTAGIILQLLVGSKIINWDMSNPDSRKKFQSTSKLLAVAFAFLEAGAFVMAGALPVEGGPFTFGLVVFQLALGGIIVILLDDLVSKWGFGSGISLFIAAGVGSQIIVRILSPLVAGCIAWDFASCIPSAEQPPAGLLWQGLGTLFTGGDFTLYMTAFMPIISTALVFLLVVYLQSVKVEVPLAFSALRGFGRNWSLKLFYTSNVPVILTAALLANLQLMGRIGLAPDPVTGLTCGLLGCFDSSGGAVSGLAYYLSHPVGASGHGLLTDFVTFAAIPASEFIRAATYIVTLMIGALIFSMFWVSTAGMDAKSVSRQIGSVGMQIPGYRRDPRIIESVLNRYIPALAVLGGLAVGLLAGVADVIGAVGTGTGILLTVMIIYNYYEELRNQRLDEAHPVIRKILGG